LGIRSKTTSQAQFNAGRFSKKIRCKYTTLSKIEAGIITKPTVHIMAQIAKALNVSIEDLIK